MSELQLTTPRLRLRPLHLDDVDALWPFVTDPALSFHMTWEAHRDRAETRAFIDACEASRSAGTGCVWAITAHDGALVGTVGLHDITRQVRAWRRDVAELGYWIAPPHQGRGYVTEAARAVVDDAFGRLALHKVVVGCIADNVASRRVIEKLGFRFVGTQRDHAFRHGRWWDLLGYELTAPEWRAAAGG